MSLRIYGNRTLKTLPGLETRPTPAKVRQAVFNIWQGSVLGCRWLDLCTGTGAMGAEALCRGAVLAVGIEQSRKACALIQQNWQQVAKPEQRFQVLQGDVLRQLSQLSGSFDRIYFDPPYASDLYEPVLTLISQHQLLATKGVMAAEHNPERTMPETIANLALQRQKVYGNTAVSFYALQQSGPEQSEPEQPESNQPESDPSELSQSE